MKKILKIFSCLSDYISFQILKLHSILIGSVFLLIGCDTVHSTSSGWFWKHEPFHTAVESLGTFAAITLAILILLILRQNKDVLYHFWTACALIGMGILDGFHAFVHPGNSFVWLHSIATFFGGMLFALVWFPKRFVPSHRISTIPVVSKIQ